MEKAIAQAGDITFECRNCASPLVVDCAAAGLTLPCQRCGLPTPVPSVPDAPAPALPPSNEQLGETQRQLKENESQRTEVTGYINQLTIQLHRWQLRLQTLDERRRELTSKLGHAARKP